MPSNLTGWRSHKNGDSCMIILDAITCKGGANEILTKEQVIEDLAIVKFKWKSSETNKKLKIEFSFTITKHSSAKHRRIKVNIGSDTLKYFKQDLDAPENWSDMQLMGFMEPIQRDDIYTCICDFYISAFEVKMDKLCAMLYTDTDFTDFHLATTEGTVAVHKSCLAAHSEVFKTMLTGEWKETVEGKVNIDGVSLQTLQDLKNYMYLGTIPNVGLCPLLLIAKYYLMEDLQKHCIRKLAETVLPEELFSLLEFACVNNIPELSYAMLQITRDSVVSQASSIRKRKRLTIIKD